MGKKIKGLAPKKGKSVKMMSPKEEMVVEDDASKGLTEDELHYFLHRVPEKVFEEADANGDGSLQLDEFLVLMGWVGNAIGAPRSREDMEALFKAIDKDDSGEIDLNEFL